MDIGNRIKELRIKIGLTQDQLADKCGLSKNAIWNYENNRRSPTIEILDKIAEALEVSVNDLIEGTKNKEMIFNSKENKSVEKVSKSLSDDPELSEFWNTLKEREDLKLLFKQTKSMAPNDIKKIIRVIKAIEDEEDRNDG